MFREGRAVQRSIQCLFLAAVLVVVMATLAPASEISVSVDDKLLHLIAYFGLGIIGGTGWPSRRRFLLLLIPLLGLTLEIVQGAWIPSRYFDLSDAGANILGAFMGGRGIHTRLPGLIPKTAEIRCKPNINHRSKEDILMKILVLQHERVEHPGIFRDFLKEDGHQWVPVEMDEGEVPPSLDGFDALWVMGGPMDVWQEDEHPWLVAEKTLIKDAVERRGMPFLGLCLGHQLLAEALGGTVGPSKVPEIGVMSVQQTEEGGTSVILDGLPTVFECLQWHSAEITSLPQGAKVLATSPDCAVQAMSWGPRAFSAQFHIEIEADTVENWAQIPEYRDALIAALGAEGVAKMKTQCDAQMDAFATNAERLYINWMQTTARV